MVVMLLLLLSVFQWNQFIFSKEPSKRKTGARRHPSSDLLRHGCLSDMLIRPCWGPLIEAPDEFKIYLIHPRSVLWFVSNPTSLPNMKDFWQEHQLCMNNWKLSFHVGAIPSNSLNLLEGQRWAAPVHCSIVMEKGHQSIQRRVGGLWTAEHPKRRSKLMFYQSL